MENLQVTYKWKLSQDNIPDFRYLKRRPLARGDMDTDYVTTWLIPTVQWKIVGKYLEVDCIKPGVFGDRREDIADKIEVSVKKGAAGFYIAEFGDIL